MMTAAAPEIITLQSDTMTTHWVTEKELPYYEEYVSSNFDLLSYTVLILLYAQLSSYVYTYSFVRFLFGYVCIAIFADIASSRVI